MTPVALTTPSITQRLLEKLTEAVIESSEKVRASIEAGYTQTDRGTRLQAARNGVIYGNSNVSTSAGRLLGWSVLADAADVLMTLHDGRSSDADMLAAVRIPAGEASNVSLPGSGLSVTEGVFVAVSAPVRGSIYLGARD